MARSSIALSLKGPRPPPLIASAAVSSLVAAPPAKRRRLGRTWPRLCQLRRRRLLSQGMDALWHGGPQRLQHLRMRSHDKGRALYAGPVASRPAICAGQLAIVEPVPATDGPRCKREQGRPCKAVDVKLAWWHWLDPSALRRRRAFRGCRKNEPRRTLSNVHAAIGGEGLMRASALAPSTRRGER